MEQVVSMTNFFGIMLSLQYILGVLIMRLEIYARVSRVARSISITLNLIDCYKHNLVREPNADE